MRARQLRPAQHDKALRCILVDLGIATNNAPQQLQKPVGVIVVDCAIHDRQCAMASSYIEQWPSFRDHARVHLAELNRQLVEGKLPAEDKCLSLRERELARELKVITIMNRELAGEVDTLALERDESRRAAEVWRREARRTAPARDPIGEQRALNENALRMVASLQHAIDGNYDAADLEGEVAGSTVADVVNRVTVLKEERDRAERTSKALNTRLSVMLKEQR